MKKKQKIIVLGLIIVLLIIGSVFYYLSEPTDRCTAKDREINNCVPAGKCGPTPEIDAAIDCDVKNYDKKYNPEI